MAFKMKGPSLYRKAPLQKKGHHKMPDGSMMADSAMKHFVDDNREHNDPEHSDDLQTPKEHKTGKVDKKKKKKSTESAHGQLNDAKADYKQDRLKAKGSKDPALKQALTGPDKPHGQETLTKGFTSDSDYEGIVNDKKNMRSYIRKYDKMSKEDLAAARIRNTGQTVIRTKGDKSKNAQKITIRKGPDKRT